MTRQQLTVYVDASLLAGDGRLALSVASDVQLRAVIVSGEPLADASLPPGVQVVARVPDDLSDAWHVTDQMPEVGSRAWSRTLMVGPRVPAGRRAITGLRQARDLRVALLELAAEQAVD